MSTELNALEHSIARNEEIVAKGNALERLKSNPDFKKVVGEGYLEREAVRLVHLKGEQTMQKPDMQASIQAEIDAIGNFAQYLRNVTRFAEMAASSLEADEATREEIAAEELAK